MHSSGPFLDFFMLGEYKEWVCVLCRQRMVVSATFWEWGTLCAPEEDPCKEPGKLPLQLCTFVLPSPAPSCVLFRKAAHRLLFLSPEVFRSPALGFLQNLFFLPTRPQSRQAFDTCTIPESFVPLEHFKVLQLSVSCFHSCTPRLFPVAIQDRWEDSQEEEAQEP